MADTARTWAAVQTLLADNSVGNISAQDLRDAFESFRNDHGEMSITSSVEDTISSLNVWYEARASTWTLTTTPAANNFTMGTNGRLQYDGNETRMFHVAASFSVTSAANNKTFEFGIGVDGTVSTPSIISRKIATGADVGSSALHAFVQVASGSYLTLMVRNTTDTTNPTFAYANMFAMGMIK